jgi:hypothetical protein
MKQVGPEEEQAGLSSAPSLTSIRTLQYRKLNDHGLNLPRGKSMKLARWSRKHQTRPLGLSVAGCSVPWRTTACCRTSCEGYSKLLVKGRSPGRQGLQKTNDAGLGSSCETRRRYRTRPVPLHVWQSLVREPITSTRRVCSVYSQS